jgi:hypothetical protein
MVRPHPGPSKRREFIESRRPSRPQFLSSGRGGTDLTRPICSTRAGCTAGGRGVARRGRATPRSRWAVRGAGGARGGNARELSRTAPALRPGRRRDTPRPCRRGRRRDQTRPPGRGARRLRVAPIPGGRGFGEGETWSTESSQSRPSPEGDVEAGAPNPIGSTSIVSSGPLSGAGSSFSAVVMADASISSRSGQAGDSSRRHGAAGSSWHASPWIRVRADSRAVATAPSPSGRERSSDPLSSRERVRVRAPSPADATWPSPRPSPGGRGGGSSSHSRREWVDSVSRGSWRSPIARSADGWSSPGRGDSSVGVADDSTRTNLPGATRTQVTFGEGSDTVLVLDRPRPLPRRFLVGSPSDGAIGSWGGSAVAGATGSGPVLDGPRASAGSEGEPSNDWTGRTFPEGAEGRCARSVASPAGGRTIQAISRR